MRITTKILTDKINSINEMLDRPLDHYQPREDTNKVLIANPGHFSLDAAIGGYRLVETSQYGGEIDITNHRMSGKEFANFLTGFVCGMKAQRDSAVTA